MPYVQVDLDAKKKFPLVARGLGVSVADVALGFLDLWEPCFAQVETVTLLQLECMFGAKGDRVAAVLADFGFLENRTDGVFRIRGANRYRTISDRQAEAGRARARSGLRNPAGQLIASKSSREPAEQPAEQPAGWTSQPALDPRSEIRDPIPNKSFAGTKTPASQDDQQGDLLGVVSKPDAKSKSAKRKDPNPRHTPLKLRLVAAFREKRGGELAWDGGEAKALDTLIGREISDDEICRRFALMLETPGYYGSSSVSGLSKPDRWNHFAGTGPPKKPDDKPKLKSITSIEEARKLNAT
jgi:hypothetical protein